MNTTSQQQKVLIIHSESKQELLQTLNELGPKGAEIFVLTAVGRAKHLGERHEPKRVGKRRDLKRMGQCRELQCMGLDVQVEEYRLPDEDGRSLLESKNNLPAHELKRLTDELAKPIYQLRAKRELEAQNAADKASTQEQIAVRNELTHNSYIYPNGGYAKVTLANPVNNKTYTGECHFNLSEPFNRRIAIRCSFGKMYRKLLTDSSMGYRIGKTVISNLISAGT